MGLCVINDVSIMFKCHYWKPIAIVSHRLTDSGIFITLMTTSWISYALLWLASSHFHKEHNTNIESYYFGKLYIVQAYQSSNLYYKCILSILTADWWSHFWLFYVAVGGLLCEWVPGSFSGAEGVQVCHLRLRGGQCVHGCLQSDRNLWSHQTELEMSPCYSKSSDSLVLIYLYCEIKPFIHALCSI